MTREEVQTRIDEIRKHMRDDEMAHVLEDKLRGDLLAAIANGTCLDPVGCAQLALTTDDLDFERWCA